MSTNAKTNTQEQNQLIAEFSAAYGLQPEQITFFDNDPQPFFDRDATSVLLHRLLPVAGIEDEPFPSPLGDAIAIKYRITFEDGSFASSTGVANIHEKGSDGAPLTFEQLQSLATARAARRALRNKGIDLVKLHYQRSRAGGNPTGREGAPSNTIQFSGPPRSERETLLRQVHALGRESGLIFDDYVPDPNDRHSTTKATNKDQWRRVLASRYGVEASNDLNDTQLGDFAAFLKSIVPTPQAAA